MSDLPTIHITGAVRLRLQTLKTKLHFGNMTETISHLLELEKAQASGPALSPPPQPRSKKHLSEDLASKSRMRSGPLSFEMVRENAELMTWLTGLKEPARRWLFKTLNLEVF